MLIAKVEDQRVSIEGNGSMENLAVDIGMIINSIYSQMKRSGESEAKDFRRMVMYMVRESGPIWKDDNGSNLFGIAVCHEEKKK